MSLRIRPGGRRRVMPFAAATVLTATSLVLIPVSTAHAAVTCSIDYTQAWSNDTQFGANVVINNTGDAVNGWSLSFTLPNNATIQNGWPVAFSQSGSQVTISSNAQWNDQIPSGGQFTLGFNANGQFGQPSSFTFNGVTCGSDIPPEPQALVVEPTSVTVPEGGTATFSVRLQSQPSGNVTVTSTAGSGDSDITVASGATLTFTPSNWQTPQTVTLAAAEDADTTNGSRTITVASSGLTSVSVTATELDNDTPQTQALIVSPTTVNVPEGGTATFSVRLQTQPSGNVTVTSTAGSGDSDITVASGATLTFTPSNWQTPQTVTLAAAQDADTTSGSRTITVASTGLSSVTVTATEIDDDVPAGQKVDNPFAGATGYINPEWRDRVLDEADQRSGTLANQMRNIANTSTAVWMDRIGAITDGLGLEGHLDEAVAQDAANGSQPVVITVVIYDLPNRDCAALASSGELLIANNGFNRYKTEYIDVIRSIMAQSKYANLRIALIIEPDSLPNLVTNLSTPACAEANGPGGYVDGVRYAVSQLSSLPNTYLYVDIAHSGWLGWPNNYDGVLQVMDRTFSTSQGGPGYDKLHGFITNTANYTPTEEIFLTNPQLQVGGQQVMSASFYEWNPRLDEHDYATDLQSAFQSRGCNAPNTCGIIIDTSRNGWGGANRPTAVSTSTNVNTYVDQSRIDRRPHRGGWCNQAGAGIGARPTANTGITGVDAFVWVKPPGESDGVSEDGIVDPNDPAKRFDPMCDPNAQSHYNSQYGTNAMANAPHAGRWFPEQFAMLVQNAYPAIPSTP
jgi:cellulose 1,4-beta-cellobiosidase